MYTTYLQPTPYFILATLHRTNTYPAACVTLKQAPKICCLKILFYYFQNVFERN